MRAAVLESPQSQLTIADLEPTELGAHDVLVRVRASGLCHSDLSMMEAAETPFPLPCVLGHEGAGVVEEVGREVTSLRRGDRVIASWVPACGHCFWCINNEPNLCADFGVGSDRPRWRTGDGRDVWTMTGIGTMAEAMQGSERSFVKVETDLPDEHLALIGCGVTTGVCAALNAARVRPGSSVAVFGCGGVGQSVIQGARIAGAVRIIAVDPVELKREMARKMGATHTVDAAAGDAVEAVRALTGGRGPDFAFEAAGRPETATQAVLAARRGGLAVCVGAGQPDIAGISLIDSKTVMFTLYGDAFPARDFPRLVSMVETGLLDLDSMISRRIGLDDVNEGFAAMERGEVIRSVIVN